MASGEMPGQATKEEIARHIAALNRAWQRYDGLAESAEPRMRARLSEAYMKEVEWLYRYGISDVELAYDDASKVFSLPG